MKLLTFEASDLEKGGSSGKVVECILCLKGYYEWKQSSGIGVWRYGGTVKIESFSKGPPSSTVGSESADESFDDSESSHYEQLLDYPYFNGDVSLEESNSADAFALLFDCFGLGLQAYFTEVDKIEDMPLNSMVIDIMMRKVAKDFSSLLVSRSNQELRSFSKQTRKEFQRFQAGCEEEFRRLELHIKILEVSASSYHKVLEENCVLYNQVQDLKGLTTQLKGI